MKIHLLTIYVITSLLSFFSFAQQLKQNEIPEWVLMPEIENGLTATSCQPLGDSILFSKRMAQSQAMIDLASFLNTQVSALLKEYTKQDLPEQASEPFQSSSKSLINQKLTKVKLLKTQKVNLFGEINICVQLALYEDKDEVEENVIQTIEEQNYKEFKSQQAIKALENELEVAN